MTLPSPELLLRATFDGMKTLLQHFREAAVKLSQEIWGTGRIRGTHTASIKPQLSGPIALRERLVF